MVKCVLVSHESIDPPLNFQTPIPPPSSRLDNNYISYLLHLNIFTYQKFIHVTREAWCHFFPVRWWFFFFGLSYFVEYLSLSLFLSVNEFFYCHVSYNLMASVLVLLTCRLSYTLQSKRIWALVRIMLALFYIHVDGMSAVWKLYKT